jgi:hypothetical protein
MPRLSLILSASALPVLAAGLAQAQTLTEVWRTSGFAAPESAWFDAGSGQIIVSNIGGFGPDTGMDGKLSLLGSDGAVTNADWITGLMDPKGMASADGVLYVADAPGLQVIDIASGSVTQTVAVEGAMLLNDVTIGSDGAVYVTDMLAGGIVKYADGAVSWLIAPGGISLPNGILWDNDALIVGTFGEGMQADMSVTTPGGLVSVDPASGAITPIEATAQSGSVDGIARIGDLLIYDDNPTGKLLAVGADGALAQVGMGEAGAADLGAAGDLVVVPYMYAGTVAAYRVE